jgi:ferritin
MDGKVPMKISKELEQSINRQMNCEYQSAYIYLGMAAYFETTPLTGFARWMRNQAEEEVAHGGKFFSYLASREGGIELRPIERAATSFHSPAEAFAVAHAHEQKVTGWIHGIYDLAVREKDYETQEFLGWFIKEQIEEEEQVRNWCERLRLADGHPDALLFLDAVAGKRAD